MQEMKFIEDKAGFNFQIIGEPDKDHLAKTKVNSIKDQMQTINPKILEYFLEDAEVLAQNPV